MVVERERERMAFRKASYWDVEGDFAPQGSTGQAFTARLSAVDAKRVATGRDFDDAGQLKGANVVHLDDATAHAIAEGVRAAAVSVTDVQEKPYTRRPSRRSPPRRCSRRPAASCACPARTPCGWPSGSTRTA